MQADCHMAYLLTEAQNLCTHLGQGHLAKREEVEQSGWKSERIRQNHDTVVSCCVRHFCAQVKKQRRDADLGLEGWQRGIFVRNMSQFLELALPHL